MSSVSTVDNINKSPSFPVKASLSSSPSRHETIKKIAVVVFNCLAGITMAVAASVGLGLSAKFIAVGVLCYAVVNLFIFRGLFPKIKTLGIAASSQEFVEKNHLKMDEIVAHLLESISEKKQLEDGQLDQVLSLVDEAKVKFNQLLLEVQNEGKMGLIFDDKEIEEKFKVAELLMPLSEEEKLKRKKILQTVINTAYVNAELKEKGKNVSGSTTEGHLLKSLGYSSSLMPAYQDKARIHSILTEVIYGQIKEEHTTCSLTALRSFVKECALQARLRSVNIFSLNTVHKFKSALIVVNKKHQDLTKLHKEEAPITLDEDFPKLGKIIVESTFYSDKNALARKITNAKVADAKECFEDEAISPSQFRSTLSDSLSNIDHENFVQDCKKLVTENTDMAFYANYGKYLKAEMAQGLLDEQEALANGVCKGFCFRVVGTHQRNPKVTVEEIVPDIKVKQTDRFNQAFYATNFLTSGEYFPEKLMKKFNFTEHSKISSIDNTHGLENEINSHRKKIRESNGWLLLSLRGKEGGHAIILRLDPIEKKAWIIDPNIGLMVFEEIEPNYTQAEEKFFECFQMLMATNYPTHEGITLWQLG